MPTGSNEWAWYARAAADARAALRAMRVERGIEWTIDGSHLWLRGRELTARLPAMLARGGGVLFRTTGKSGLARAHPRGLRVPTARIPDSSWHPASELFGVEVPPAAIAGDLPDRTPLGLARGGPLRAPAALRITVAALADWANDAPATRLGRLEFAADASGDALVVGTPLPPLAGTIYWQEAGVFVPTGFRLDPNVDGPTARSVMTARFSESGAGDRFVIDRHGASRLAAGAFVPAGRSALRATLAEVRIP